MTSTTEIRLPTGRRSVEGELHAGHLREAAAGFLDLAEAVFQRGADIGALDLEGRNRILERQDGNRLAHRDIAGVDRGTQAAAIGDGDGHALTLDAVEHGVGHQVAHLAFLGAAGVAGAVDRCFGLADDLGLQLFDRLSHLLDAGKHGFIRLEFGIDQDRIALGGFDDAVIVEIDDEIAEILAVGTGLDDRNLVAAGIVDHRRIGAFGLLVGVGQAGCANGRRRRYRHRGSWR